KHTTGMRFPPLRPIVAYDVFGVSSGLFVGGHRRKTWFSRSPKALPPYISETHRRGFLMFRTRDHIPAAVVLAALLSALSSPTSAGPADSVWIQLFNKADTNIRNDWDVKIRGEGLNQDPRRTFRWAVAGSDTVLEVNYSGYTGNFGGDNGP